MAHKIRRRRVQMKLSQRAVAKSVGCVQSYVAQVEGGRCPCSRRVAEKLELLFKVKRGTFTRFEFPRGRPRLQNSAKQILGQIRCAVKSQPDTDLAPIGRAPAYPRSNLVKPVENPFWPMGIHLGQRAADEVLRLERQKGVHDKFWRLANSLRFDSWSEKRLVVQLGLRCEQLVPMSLGGLGSQLCSVDGVTGRDTNGQVYPTFLLRHNAASIAWVPQCCVRSHSGYRWPDAVVVVAMGGCKVTVVVEIDGPRYHQNVRQGEARDRDLGVSVLHVHPDVLGQAEGLNRILDWACSKLL